MSTQATDTKANFAGHLKERLPNMRELDLLESEAIYILREAAGQFDRLGMCFSGGKDSVVLLRLAQKAFYPGKPPIELIHIDTGFNFPEVLKFISKTVELNRLRLNSDTVEDFARREGKELSPRRLDDRFRMQGQVLDQLVREKGFGGVLGGGRRDEDRARAKERMFSFRDSFGQWDPKNQRPELWSILNGRINLEEHVRVFPISNWTEFDVWLYILRESQNDHPVYGKLELPEIYFSHERSVILRHDKKSEGEERPSIILDGETGLVTPRPQDEIARRRVRCRTVGDVPTTGFVESDASSIEDIIYEVAVSRHSERSTRPTDGAKGETLEDLKIVGHF